MREREGGEEAPAGARTWMTTPDAKQQVRSRLATHARQIGVVWTREYSLKKGRVDLLESLTAAAAMAESAAARASSFWLRQINGWFHPVGGELIPLVTNSQGQQVGELQARSSRSTSSQCCGDASSCCSEWLAARCDGEKLVSSHAKTLCSVET